MLILPRSLLCYLFWALTLPLYMWLSVPLCVVCVPVCVCECVCLFSGLMCALDCAQIAQVQLKLSIQFLSSSYCAIFKNLNSIFIIAVGPLVLSSRNIITPTSFATSSWSSSSGSSSAPSSLSAVALLLLSHWHLIPLFALRLALSHGHLVAYCNVLHSYRCSPHHPLSLIRIRIPHAHIYSPYSRSHPISFPVTTLGGRVDKMTMETEVETRGIRKSSLLGYCEYWMHYCTTWQRGYQHSARIQESFANSLTYLCYPNPAGHHQKKRSGQT